MEKSGERDSDFILKTSLSQLSKHADRQNMLIGTSAWMRVRVHMQTIKKALETADLIVYLHCSIENWNPQPQIRHQSSSVGCVNKSDYGQNHFPCRIVLSAHSMPQRQITRKVLGTRWQLASCLSHICIAGLLPMEWSHIHLKLQKIQ